MLWSLVIKILFVRFQSLYDRFYWFIFLFDCRNKRTINSSGFNRVIHYSWMFSPLYVNILAKWFIFRGWPIFLKPFICPMYTTSCTRLYLEHLKYVTACSKLKRHLESNTYWYMIKSNDHINLSHSWIKYKSLL